MSEELKCWNGKSPLFIEWDKSEQMEFVEDEEALVAIICVVPGAGLSANGSAAGRFSGMAIRRKSPPSVLLNNARKIAEQSPKPTGRDIARGCLLPLEGKL